MVSKIEEDKELLIVQKETATIVEKARNYLLNSNETLEISAKVISWIANKKKLIEEKRKFFTQPLNDQIKKINALFRGYSDPLDEAREIMNSKILSYRAELEAKRREQEAELRRQAEKVAKKEKIPVEEILAAEHVEEAPKSIGSATIRKVKDFEIVDLKRVPYEFLQVNEKAVRQAIRDGAVSISGIRIFDREVVSTL